MVHKLFNIVQPRIAVFGKKRLPAAHGLAHMVAQMALPIAIHGETLRAKDMKYANEGGGEALTALLGNHIQVYPGDIAEFSGQLSGK